MRCFIWTLELVSNILWLIVEVTFDICANVLFETNERAEGLSWIEFKELLSVATKESYFIFNKKL